MLEKNKIIVLILIFLKLSSIIMNMNITIGDLKNKNVKNKRLIIKLKDDFFFNSITIALIVDNIIKNKNNIVLQNVNEINKTILKITKIDKLEGLFYDN